MVLSGLCYLTSRLELEAAVRFPGCVSSGPSYGVIRFIRDSVAFAVDTEKARLHGKSLIALNAAVSAFPEYFLSRKKWMEN